MSWRGIVLGCLLASVPGGASAQQTWTVKNDGTGDFDDLQVALDTVPLGATLLVYPNVAASSGFDVGWPPVTIHHWVTLVGVGDAEHSMPRIGGNDAGIGGGALRAMVVVEAGADSTVVLANLEVGAYNDGSHAPTFGVRVARVGTLVIDRSRIHGTGFPVEAPMPDYQLPAHAVVVDGAATLLSVHESVLTGGHGNRVSNVGDDGSDCHGGGSVRGCPGGDALRAPAATTLLLSHSWLTAGNGGVADWGDAWPDGCGDEAPERLRGGAGGNALTGNAWASATTFVRGAGGGYHFRDFDWGNGENGADGLDVAGSIAPLPDLLTVTGVPLRGGTLTLAGRGFAPSAVALLFVGFELAPPARLRQGTWWMAPPFLLHGLLPTDAQGDFTLADALPDDPALVGVPVVLHVADATHLSEPELFVVQEP